MIVITHYQRLLNYIVPDVVHVMAKGRVVKTGGKELALELEAKGYAQYSGRGGVSDERGSARHQDRGRAGARRRLCGGARQRCPARAVAALRDDAFKRFDARGLPHRRVEEWKYTDLRALMRDAKPLAGPARRQAKGRRCRDDPDRRRCATSSPSSTAAMRRPGAIATRTIRASRSIELFAFLAENPGLPARPGARQRRRGARAQHRLHERRRGAACQARHRSPSRSISRMCSPARPPPRCIRARW